MTDKWVADTGLILTLLFIILSVWAGQAFIWASIASLLITMLMPKLLYPIAWVWFGVAQVLNLFVSKVFFGVVFFAVVMPVGLMRRAFGIDSLGLHKHFGKKSALIDRVKNYSKEDFRNPY